MSRKQFLGKTAAMAAGALMLDSRLILSPQLQDFPQNVKLARNCTDGMINLRAKPSPNAPVIKQLYEDTTMVWLKEVVGDAPAGVYSRRWVETPEGYVYAPAVQPVWNRPNQPVSELPDTPDGRGFWAEVTVPYVDIYAINPPASPWLKEIHRPRLYYSQVMWIDDMKTGSNGRLMYRATEKYGSFGDIFWADAEAFRVITAEELTPINPQAENKLVRIDVAHQTLHCFEDNREVFYCRVSTGAMFDAQGNRIEKWGTPLGEFYIWRKLISLHMSGGSSGAGWDTPGIPWTCLFGTDGVAVHSTFWHNDFGTPRSHGCVNCLPEDAKWVFRWTMPEIEYSVGDLTIQGMGMSTKVAPYLPA